MNWKVRLRGTRHIEALRRAPDRLARELDRAAGRGALEIAREAKRRAPKATSLLTSSITTSRLGLGRHRVIAGADYAPHVEAGRQPGRMPPTRSILDWIRVRGIAPNDPSMSQRDLAFVIARSIARRGIAPQPFFEPAIRAKESRLQQLIDEGTERALA